MSQRKQAGFSKTDMTMLVLVVLLAVFGLTVLGSASEYNGRVRFGDSAYYFKKQLFATALGLGAMYVVSIMDYHFFVRLAPALYLLSMALSTAVLLVRPGDQRIETVAEPGAFILSAVGIRQGGSYFVSHLADRKSRQYRRVLVYVQDHVHFASHCGAGRLQ